jgi:hypothetical protein
MAYFLAFAQKAPTSAAFHHAKTRPLPETTAHHRARKIAMFGRYRE